MAQRSFFNITVAGGSPEENQQLSTLVYASLTQQGFTNIGISSYSTIKDTQGQNVFDAVRAQNPDLFDTPINVLSETEDELFYQENSALAEIANSLSNISHRFM